MQDTAGTWLMTVLTTSPLLIALMQTAASLPVLFLGLLAGATADIYERRRLLLFWQSWMLASVAVLAVLTFVGVITPVTLLLFTFLLNIGSAMNNPAWQAIVPELVPREEIPNAVTLNAASNNIARALGPALGGLMIAAFAVPHRGAGWVFALNSASFAGVIWILWRWKRKPVFKSALPAERIAGSVRSGLRYLRYAPDLQGPLIRAFTFTFFVSAVWSLLALVAKSDLHQGAMGYGILNGCLGLGAGEDSGGGDRGAAGRGVCVDDDDVDAECVGAAVGPGVGLRARIGNVSDDVPGRAGAGQRGLGSDCATDLDEGVVDLRGDWAGGEPAVHAEDPYFEGGAAGPYAVYVQATAAGVRGDGRSE
jgi:MFS family permease